MKRFKRAADRNGNHYVIVVNDEGHVMMANQHGIACSLASVYNGANNGHDAACAAVRKAAHEGIVALENVSGYKWTELPKSVSDLEESQKDTIRARVNDMLNAIAEECQLSVDQAPAAKALIENIVRRQNPSSLVE